MNLRAVAPLVAALLMSTVASAHGDDKHDEHAAISYAQTDWGMAGRPKAATRTIKLRMLDTMRFVPEQITVRQGETVRFLISNEGKMLHEFVLGTQRALDEHAAMMLKMPEMKHSAAYMAHVAPGKTEVLLWKFNRPGQFDFACLIAGHYQAGMKGRVTVSAD